MSPRSRPLIMGIVNVTPDSFSDGGRFLNPEAALAHARRLIAEGADILDIGGESTRPGAAPTTEADEIGRIVPLIEAIRRESAMPVSVDTMKPAVARAAVAAGATMWNDVAALTAPGALESAAKLGCEMVLMHMRGEPRTMQANPRYDDVVAEVTAFLAARADAAIAAGVARDKIWLDPGYGFGKTPAHNLALVRGLGQIAALGFPVLFGASRKARSRRSLATAPAPVSVSAAQSLSRWPPSAPAPPPVRVHDVAETRQALAVDRAIGHISPGMSQPEARGRVLAIAGSDSGGGAGVQADIKTVTALGGYAASAITAVTVPDTRGVAAIHPIPPPIIAAQIRAVLADIGADAIKTGMLGEADAVRSGAGSPGRVPGYPAHRRSR